MVDCNLFADLVLSDCNSQTRTVRNLNIAVLIVKHRRISQIIEHVAGLVVMNIQTLFLNERVMRAGVYLQVASASGPSG